jgi:hypothetical protein
MNDASLVAFDNQARDVYMCHSCGFRDIRSRFYIQNCPEGCLEVIDERNGLK